MVDEDVGTYFAGKHFDVRLCACVYHSLRITNGGRSKPLPYRFVRILLFVRRFVINRGLRAIREWPLRVCANNAAKIARDRRGRRPRRPVWHDGICANKAATLAFPKEGKGDRASGG